MIPRDVSRGFSGRDLLFARPEERLSLVSLGSRSGCSEPPLSLSSEWAPLPQAPPWSAPRQGSGPGSPSFGVRRWRANRCGGEPLIGGTEPSGVLRLLAPWFPRWISPSCARSAGLCMPPTARQSDRAIAPPCSASGWRCSGSGRSGPSVGAQQSADRFAQHRLGGVNRKRAADQTLGDLKDRAPTAD